jgi:putative glutamine amidotransferase
MKSAPTILVVPCTERRGKEMEDASISLSNRYCQAVVDAGGLPWVMPCVKSRLAIVEAVRRCDGVMLTGGDDVAPEFYGAKLRPGLRKRLGPVDPDRDWLDLAVIREVFKQRKPLLAICRGAQILNVALGGTLIVDIPTQHPEALPHNRMDRKSQVVHEVSLTPGSLLAKIAGRSRLGVNSTHHQAVGRVARPLRVVATSADGIIEGLELDPASSPRLFFLVAVQFHPERLYDRMPVWRALFRRFVIASLDRRRKGL